MPPAPDPAVGRCGRRGCRTPMRIVKPGQRYHPLCDPTDEVWWPPAEQAAYLARTRPTPPERTDR